MERWVLFSLARSAVLPAAQCPTADRRWLAIGIPHYEIAAYVLVGRGNRRRTAACGALASVAGREDEPQTKPAGNWLVFQPGGYGFSIAMPQTPKQQPIDGGATVCGRYQPGGLPRDDLFPRPQRRATGRAAQPGSSGDVRFQRANPATTADRHCEHSGGSRGRRPGPGEGRDRRAVHSHAEPAFSDHVRRGKRPTRALETRQFLESFQVTSQ